MVMFLIAYTYILKVVIPIDLFDRAIMLVSQSVVQIILQRHKKQRFFTFDCVVEPWDQVEGGQRVAVFGVQFWFSSAIRQIQ